MLDDDIDDDRETLTLTLSNADGAIIEDGVATGTIRNTDALPKAWLSRFGRSAAVQVVTLLDERFEAAAGERHPARPGGPGSGRGGAAHGDGR